MTTPHPAAELLEAIAAAVTDAGGTIVGRDAETVRGTLTAIVSKWFFGGRKVTDSVTCRLLIASHEVHLREVAAETSWGLPPPTLTIQTTRQSGSRVTSTRTDTTPAKAGGGRLEFGRFRDAVEQATRAAGWTFVYDVP